MYFASGLDRNNTRSGRFNLGQKQNTVMLKASKLCCDFSNPLHCDRCKSRQPRHKIKTTESLDDGADRYLSFKHTGYIVHQIASTTSPPTSSIQHTLHTEYWLEAPNNNHKWLDDVAIFKRLSSKKNWQQMDNETIYSKNNMFPFIKTLIGVGSNPQQKQRTQNSSDHCLWTWTLKKRQSTLINCEQPITQIQQSRTTSIHQPVVFSLTHLKSNLM